MAAHRVTDRRRLLWISLPIDVDVLGSILRVAGDRYNDVRLEDGEGATLYLTVGPALEPHPLRIVPGQGVAPMSALELQSNDDVPMAFDAAEGTLVEDHGLPLIAVGRPIAPMTELEIRAQDGDR